MNDNSTFGGGCACGAVRFVVKGPHRRSGLCHCLTCQQSHGAPFNHFVIFARDAATVSGEVLRWESSPGYERASCVACGSPVFDVSADEIEFGSGNFDPPATFAPEYESWTKRRQAWLQPLDVPQFKTDRTP